MNNLIEKIKMHKFHNKILLGLAAITVIVGVVYVSSQTRGQVATCAPKTYELSKVTGVMTYKSDSGDTLTYDGASKLTTSSSIGTFSSDGGNTWSAVLDLTVFSPKVVQFLYQPIKGDITSIQTFENVTFDGTSLKFTTEYCAPCATTITLDKANLTYTTPLGNIIFGGNVLYSTNPALVFSPDNIKFAFSLDLYSFKGSTIYLMDKITGATFSLINVVYVLDVSLTFDIPCVVPPPCIPNTTEKVTLSSAAPTYTLFDGTDLRLTTGVDTFTLDSTTNEFSLATWLPDFFPTVGKLPFDQSKVPFTLYVKNIATGVVTNVTVVAVDTTLGTLTILAPVCGPEFTASLQVSVEQVEGGFKRTDAALEVKVFNVENGAVEGILTQPQNYAQIYNKTTAENTGNETNSPVVGNSPRNLKTDLVSIGANKGNKLVLVRSQQNVDGSYGYMGFDIPNLLDGQLRDVGFNIVPGQDTTFVQTSYFTKNSQGFWQSARRAQVIRGSELSVFQPDDIIWTDGTQIYPFLFISDSDWTVDVCLEVPAGYQVVAPGTCGQTLIANETKVMEFKVADIGSPKNFNTKVKMNFTNKGKKQSGNYIVKSYNPKGK